MKIQSTRAKDAAIDTETKHTNVIGCKALYLRVDAYKMLGAKNG